MELPYIKPYKTKMVENITTSTKTDREKWIKEADYNMFNLRSDQVIIDLLTDSGTGAMSDNQWAEMMKGDESYAGSTSFLKLRQTIRDLLGFHSFLPTHQGRAAENILFSALLKEGDIVPGNSHFDTTKGHIEMRKANAVDCTIDEAFDTESTHPFKGNLDLNKLENVYKKYPKEKIPITIITITCNSSGGQPVSMQNIKDVSKLSKKYGITLFYDAARFAENAYFIKEREDNYKDKTIKEIVKEMFTYVDGCTMSSKKDAIVNMGGFVAFRDRPLYEKVANFDIIYEGFVTYGGMAGRDMAALAQGLDEATEYGYLQSRVKQIEYLGETSQSYGIPIQTPIGGHAIFVDAKRFYPHIPQSEFPAQLLAVELYKEAGVRGVEIGTLLADRNPITRENRYPKLELMRLAVPRRVYNNNQMKYVAVALKNVFDRRNEIKKGLKIIWEADIMRHFTVKLDKIN